jgi:hypothetical protein
VSERGLHGPSTSFRDLWFQVRFSGDVSMVRTILFTSWTKTNSEMKGQKKEFSTHLGYTICTCDLVDFELKKFV